MRKIGEARGVKERIIHGGKVIHINIHRHVGLSTFYLHCSRGWISLFI